MGLISRSAAWFLQELNSFFKRYKTNEDRGAK